MYLNARSIQSFLVSSRWKTTLYLFNAGSLHLDGGGRAYVRAFWCKTQPYHLTACVTCIAAYVLIAGPGFSPNRTADFQSALAPTTIIIHILYHIRIESRKQVNSWNWQSSCFLSLNNKANQVPKNFSYASLWRALYNHKICFSDRFLIQFLRSRFLSRIWIKKCLH